MNTVAKITEKNYYTEEENTRKRKKYLLLALVVSPCHSFLVVPLLSALLSGTTLGMLITSNNLLLTGIITGIFVTAVYVYFKRKKTCEIEKEG